MTEDDIRKAYVRMREVDHTIPTEVLELMKDAALHAFDSQYEDRVMSIKDAAMKAENVLHFVNTKAENIRLHVGAHYGPIETTLIDKLEAHINCTTTGDGCVVIDIDNITEWLEENQDDWEDQEFVDFLVKAHDEVPIHMEVTFYS